MTNPKSKKDVENAAATNSSAETNFLESLSQTSGQDGVEDTSEDDEPQIPFSQMQRLVTQQVRALMSQWVLANQAQHAQSGSVQSKAKDLPALEKLKNFKGETDTDELDTWLKELQRHCTYYAIGGSLDTEEKKLAYAVSHLVGGAEAWWDTQKLYIKSYSGFITAITKRFRSAVDADKAADELYDLKQKDGQSVTAFSDRFMQLLTRIPSMHEEDRMRHFKRGLVPHLQQKVKEHKLTTLNEVIELAIRLEGTFVKKSGGIGGATKAQLNAVESEPTSHPEIQELINQIKNLAARGGAGTGAGSGPSTSPTGDRCWRCGSPDHITEKCIHKGNVCFYCKKAGHIKADCKSLKARQAREEGQKK